MRTENHLTILVHALLPSDVLCIERKEQRLLTDAFHCVVGKLRLGRGGHLRLSLGPLLRLGSRRRRWLRRALCGGWASDM